MAPRNWLNPSAGDVPLPNDPREIDAALRAGRVSWRLFPYYRWRYGDRGAAFTRSDSAWLVTLCEHSPDHVQEQIAWLGSVLSNRGMPQWLLELHLKILYRQLARAVPENERSYEKLLAASFALRTERRQRISEARFEGLSRQFAARVGAPAHPWMLGAGRLLVAATADEKGGMPHAVARLESWLTEPARFEEARASFSGSLGQVSNEVSPDRWAEAVREIIDEARRG